jgi:hypothetical protein
MTKGNSEFFSGTSSISKKSWLYKMFLLSDMFIYFSAEVKF